MTFLLSEDKALRLWLQELVVHDQKADGVDTPRQVGVWFGQPDQELRPQSYPYITIDMIDVQRDPAREMRGYVKPEYITPPDFVHDDAGELVPYDPDLHDWRIELPIPVNIDYQITTYARHPRHDRELLSQLLHQKLVLRFGQLDIEDGTNRRLEVMDVSKRDVTEQAKRLFVNAITVRVSSEIVQATLQELYKVQERNITTSEN
jgi:hypothetical protein